MTGSAKKILLLLTSAAAYPLAFPPLGWWPLAPLSVALLMTVLNHSPARHAFIIGFIWGLIGFGIGLSWLWHIFGPISLAMWGLQALYPAFFGRLIVSAQQRGLQGSRLALFMALAWTGTEFLRCELMPLRFPWLHLGLALEPWPLASWIGVYGLGFVVALVVAALIIRQFKLAGTLLAAGLIGCFLELQLVKAPAIRVTAIQAETAPLETYLSLSRQAPEGTHLIVWPEYAVAKDVRQSDNHELETIQAQAAQTGAHFVFGTQTRLGGARWQNTALTVNEHAVVGEHGKNHTVHLFDDGERGTTAESFGVILGEDESHSVFAGRIGTPICFDCDFHDTVRRMVLNGAEFLAVPSMDAISWSAKQHIQHAQLFRVRAAENRRCMVVAASSGVSQIIDHHGRATASLGALQQGVLHGSITPVRQLTFFTRLGWLASWMVLGTLAIWTTWLLALSQRKTQQQPVANRPN